MGSNIPWARDLLNDGYRRAAAAETTVEANKILKAAILAALRHMTRESPEFRAERDEVPYLTGRQKRHARRLRREGMSIRAIAAVLGVNGGRVSEACRE